MPRWRRRSRLRSARKLRKRLAVGRSELRALLHNFDAMLAGGATPKGMQIVMSQPQTLDGVGPQIVETPAEDA